jgi:uncharacterized protein (DUF885 family)
VAPLMLGAVLVSAAPAPDVFDALLQDERAHVWRSDPLAASQAGVHRYDDELPRVTPEDQAANLESDQQFLARLEDIDRAALDGRRQLSYELFEAMVRERIILAEHREWRLPLNSDSGFHTRVLLMDRLARLRNVDDYEAYLARLRAVPRYFEENTDNLRVGMRDGFTLPAAILDGVSAVIAETQYQRPEDVPLWQPFERFPAAIGEADRQRLAAAGRAVLADSVIPAYARFQSFFEQTYRPAARDTIAASALPDGGAYYADLVRYFTTLPEATPESVHRIGLEEVARIRAAMQAIVDETGFDGDFAAFIEFLRTDRQFYAGNAGELLREAAWLAKQIDGLLPGYFGTLPRTPYTVAPVPAALAPNYTAGRYHSGAPGDAGEYWVNTFALETRPLYALPALTLHEAVPGHHLQIALAREAEAVPAFRREFYPHAFGEGWGLYAERLGEEMGLYRTPYQWFGRYTYDMWRACRLVVDTGMHAFGWSRQRALDYMTEHTALSRHEIRTEVDRYIAWPGQALAYKMGELTIVELRERAATELGPKFDVRAFHDVVLGSGGVTLPVLERQVDAYIQRAR